MKQSLYILLFYSLLTLNCSFRLYSQVNTSTKNNEIDSLKTSVNNQLPEDTIFFDIPDDGVFREYEQFPKFQNGEQALINYIKSNTIYPQSAIKDSIEGRAILRFAIDIDGSICDISAIRSIRSDVDEECIRVVGEMPKWKPGRILKESNKGWYWTKSKFWYTIPFTFSLSKDENKKGIIITPR